MTTVDAFQHLCRELEKHQADTVPDVRDLVHALRTVREDVSAHQPVLSGTGVSAVAARMRDLSPVTPTPLLIDTALDGEVQLPQAVVAEVQAAVAGLYRTTPQPYGYQHWRDYHRRFRARYGVGALMPVMDLVADSGLGLPAGYVGSERGPAPKLLTDRDEVLLALVQQVLMDGRDELRLTDATIDALEKAAGSDERLFVPRVEVAFEVHAPSTAALARGAFDVLLTSVPRPGSSMAGRFAHVLPPSQQDALAATYRGAPDALPTQLVFLRAAAATRTSPAHLGCCPTSSNCPATRGPTRRSRSRTSPSPPTPAPSTSCSSPPAATSTCESCTPSKPAPRPRRWPASSQRWPPRGTPPTSRSTSAPPPGCPSCPGCATAAPSSPRPDGC